HSAPDTDRPRDLLAAVTALGALVAGGLMLAVPGRFTLPDDAFTHPPLAGYGLAFVAGGLALFACQVSSGAPRRPVVVSAHWALAAVFVLWLAGVSWPQRLW